MSNTKQTYKILFSALGMLILILDSKTALSGAEDGVSLCLHTVIPSLLPMLFLSIYLNCRLTTQRFAPLSVIGKYMGMPKGSESILLTGIFGGYPVGAQAVSQAHHAKAIDRSSAEHILSFCNNAGPAFIFGITANLFRNSITVWVLWIIHILSAFLTGILLRKPQENSQVRIVDPNPLNMTTALTKSVKILANICGWIIIFRVIIKILDQWILWILPEYIRIAIIGFLELTNGCLNLYDIETEGIRLLMCAIFLGFGGICVTMQTVSVIYPLRSHSYLKGKIMQCTLSFLMAYVAQFLILSPTEQVKIPFFILLIPIIGILITTFIEKKKKTVAKTEEVLYNALIRT